MIDKIRIATGFICIVLAWLFPYTVAASPDAMQQLFMLAMLSASVLLFGVGALPPAVLAILIGSASLLFFTPNPYLAKPITAVAGLLLSVLAFQVGVRLRYKKLYLTVFLQAIVTAALLNAVEGLLQWTDLMGGLYKWIVVPEHAGVAFGAFRQRNLFATFMCVGSVCTVWLLHLRRISESMAWVVVTILMFGLAASGSRTGGLEVFAVAMMAVYFRKSNSPAITRLLLGQLGVLGLAMISLTLIAPALGFDFDSGASRGLQSGQSARLTIWGNAIELIAQRPWTGWGWRELGFGHYTTLFDNRHNELLGNAHNLVLQLAVEFGLPFAALFFVIVLRAIFLVFRQQRDSRQIQADRDSLQEGDTASFFAWALLLAIVGIHSMLEYPLWYSGYLFLTGFAVGYVWQTHPNHELTNQRAAWSIAFAHVSAVCLLVLVLLGSWHLSKIQALFEIPFTRDQAVKSAAIKAAIESAQGAWLFQEQIDAARVVAAPISIQNADEVRILAEKVLHHSAEPPVIQPLLLSLWYLNDLDRLRFHAKRFCAAFPEAFERWYLNPSNQKVTLTLGPKSQWCGQ